MDFPTLVYRTPGEHRGPDGSVTYDYAPAADQEAFDALIADGWHETLPQALGYVEAEEIIEKAESLADAVEGVKSETRDALEAEAKRLDVSFNWKTSDQVLATRIAEAKG